MRTYPYCQFGTREEHAAWLRIQIKRVARELREEEAREQHYMRALGTLTGDDPEDDDTARIWLGNAMNAHRIAGHLEDALMRYRNELVDVRAA